MTTLKEAAEEFLAQERIAVTGVARKPEPGHGANTVYKHLRDLGHDVFAVNPNADEVEGDTCYHDLASIPDGVDAVVIATTPEVAESTMRECAELGIQQVWMHRSFGTGSVSEAAAELGREQGLTIIAGGCPLMFSRKADVPHRVMKQILSITRKLPTQV